MLERTREREKERKIFMAIIAHSVQAASQVLQQAAYNEND